MIRTAVVLLLFVLGMPTGAAHTQDFERELRWRSEIVPGLVVGEAVDLPGPGGRPFLGLLTEPADAERVRTPLLVIVHGIGVHPDHGVIGTLRMELADRGFATLAIQMPVLAADAPPEHYEPLFGNAAERIANAVQWAHGRGWRDVVLVSHSLGSRMANAYFDRAPEPGARAWIALGLGAPYSDAFARRAPLPVLDVYGERDLDPVLQHAAERQRVAAASRGRQLRIDGADHFFAGREAELVAAIERFARR